MAALAAARMGGPLARLYGRLRAAGKPFKVAIVAVMRKLVVTANAVIRDGTTWGPTQTWQQSC